MIDIFTIHLPREFASTKVYHMELCAIRDMGFTAPRGESGEKHVVRIPSGNCGKGPMRVGLGLSRIKQYGFRAERKFEGKHSNLLISRFI